MNRRGFLALIASAGIAAAAASTGLGRLMPQPTRPVPILYGDGFHDDTASLKAMLRGEPVEYDGRVTTSPAGRSIFVPPGTYQLYGPLELPKGAIVMGSTLNFDRSPKSGVVARSGSSIMNSTIMNAGVGITIEPAQLP